MRLLSLFFLIFLLFFPGRQEKEENPGKRGESLSGRYGYELCSVWVDTRILDCMTPGEYVVQRENLDYAQICDKNVHVEKDYRARGLSHW